MPEAFARWVVLSARWRALRRMRLRGARFGPAGQNLAILPTLAIFQDLSDPAKTLRP